MLSSHCLHYSLAGIARWRPWPGYACAWPNLAVFPFCAFFSPPATALRGSLPGAIPLNPGGRPTAAMPLKLQHGAGAGLRYSPVLCSRHRISVCSALFVLFALCMLTACNDWRLPKPPFGTPVDLSSGGVVADFKIRVTQHRHYNFIIRFRYPEEDRAERERVRKIVGGLHEPTPVPIPVKLMIFKKQAQNEQMVYRITVEDPDTYSASSNDFGKELGYCDLSPGEYRFVLESLAQPREYASIPTLFYVVADPRAQFNPFKPTNFDRSKSCPGKTIQ